MKERNLKIVIPLLVLLFIILGHVKNLSAEVKVPKNPKSAKGCAICHYRWIDTFFIEGKGTDLVPYNSEKLVATKEMCYSCHDGSVADSRSLISNKPIHWSNMQVNTDMQIPKYFSLGEKREFLCATCHTPHALPSGTGTQGSMFMRASTRNSEICMECHKKKAFIENTEHDLTVTAPESTNNIGLTPGESGVCGVCHLVHGSEDRIILWSQGFGEGNNIMETMCNYCHSSSGSAKDKTPSVYLHPREKLIQSKGIPIYHGSTGETAEKGNLSCPSCHNVHQWNSEIFSKGAGENIEGNLTNSFLRPRVLFEQCKECHPEDAQQKFNDFHNAEKRNFRPFYDLF